MYFFCLISLGLSYEVGCFAGSMVISDDLVYIWRFFWLRSLFEYWRRSPVLGVGGVDLASLSESGLGRRWTPQGRVSSDHPPQSPTQNTCLLLHFSKASTCVLSMINIVQYVSILCNMLQYCSIYDYNIDTYCTIRVQYCTYCTILYILHNIDINIATVWFADVIDCNGLL